MPIDDVLTPDEASRVATNVYFTLKDWIGKEPVAGVESSARIHDQVLGRETAGRKSHPKSASLRRTALGGADLGRVHEARTGLMTSTGFGYTLSFESQGRRHAVIATRGTRPEIKFGGGFVLRPADLITDIRGAVAFGSLGPVHKGFSKTFESLFPSLQADPGLAQAHTVHCVGHSLGGAVATLVAGHYASLGKQVRLYTFGSPRVGYLAAHQFFEQLIRPENIYRMSHDLDPVTLFGPYPYIHLHPRPGDIGNLTLRSPTAELFSVANHDAYQYIQTAGGRSWSRLRARSAELDQNDGALARWLLRKGADTSWVQRLSVRTLSLLFKLFAHELRSLSDSAILGLTAVDYLVEILMKGLYRGRALSARILSLLGHAAAWAGIPVAPGAEFTARLIRDILDRMLAALSQLAMGALMAASSGCVSPVPLAIGASWTLASYGML